MYIIIIVLVHADMIVILFPMKFVISVSFPHLVNGQIIFFSRGVPS